MSIESARGIGDEAAVAINEAIKRLMQRASVRASAEIAGLDVGSDGRIKPTAANIGRVNAILDRVSASLFDDAYLRDVAQYLRSLNAVSGAVSGTLVNLGASEDLLAAISLRTKSSAAVMLLNASSFSDVLGSTSSQIVNGIATSATILDVAEGVRAAVHDSGIDRGIGSQIDSAPAAMQRAQTAAASEQAGIVFYRFQGRPIPTTRPWCLQREGHVFHVEEIREWGRDAAAGRGWDGMVEGTNEQTIFTYLGGWYGNRSACRHVLVPVLRSRVPPEDLMRMRSRGLIN